MPTQPEPQPLKPMTLGENGAVQFDIDASPRAVTSLTINGIDIDPHKVFVPMTASVSSTGEIRLEMHWLVDEVSFTTDDGTVWHLTAEGRLTAEKTTTEENTHE